MPAIGEDGSIYAVMSKDGRKENVCILRLVKTSSGRGRKSLILTEDGEEWIAREIGMGAMIDDLAKELGINVTTLYTKVNGPKTKRAIQNGEGIVNNRLRRAQIKSALNGNATMLVWLGKNRLGQTDKVEASVTIEDKTSDELTWEDIQEMVRARKR